MQNKKRPLTSADLPNQISFLEDTSALKLPLKLGNKALPNRICYQPMEGCDGTTDGAPDELTVRRYLRFAKGGAGLIWFEATAVLPEGRANPRQMYLTEKTADAFASLIEKIKEISLRENGYEPLIVCQLTQSGRWSKPKGVPAPLVAYHRVPMEKNGPLPEECVLSDEYLDSLPEHYAASAKLCEKVGFDGVDIKACHGYLLSELLSAYTRKGKHGGEYQNRTRAFFESVDAVRASLSSDTVIGSRFNAFDGYPYPYGIGDSGTHGVPDFTEAERIAKDLFARGVSLLNVTMGCPYTNHEVNRPTVFAENEMPYVSIKRMVDGARAVKGAAPEAAVVVSGISFLGTLAAGVAAAGITAGDYDLAGFGRQTFSYPNLAKDIVKTGKMDKKALCLTCGKCTELMRNGRTPGCVIYDKEIYSTLYKEIKK